MNIKEPFNCFLCTLHKREILIGLASLLIGTLVYLVDRHPDQTYFVYSSPFNISLFKILPNLFGHIGNCLPSFIHVFSFIMLTAGIISCRKKSVPIVCLGWFLVDSLFELGQKFNSFPPKIIPSWFVHIPFFENSHNYFLYGRFDFNDLIAITIGTGVAYIVLMT